MSYSHPRKNHQANVMVIAAVTLCAILTLGMPRWLGNPAVLSPLSGAMIQKNLAQTSTAYDVALTNGKPTLIEFYADWCTTCQAFAPTLQAVHEQIGDRMNFVMLNIDDPQWREPIQIFQATGVPHLVLLDQDHTPVETWIGKVPQSVLLNKTELLLS